MTDEILNNINGYKLDKNQKDIVTADNKYILVTAGAGGGKTLTIIGKIKYLIEIKKVNLNEIICISFTNEATNNLEKKLKKEHNYIINCYTFHKLGLEILKENNYKITKSDTLSYTINEYLCGLININKENKKRILSYLRYKYTNKNYEKKYDKIKKQDFEKIKNIIKKFINLLKTNNYNQIDIIKLIKKEKNKRRKNLLIIILYIYINYQIELKSKKELDFDDIIIEATKKIKNNKYNKKIKYIIIDEFQDTSIIRFNLIKELLNKTNANLLVVGDDFQSIYKFSGCDLNLFTNFNSYFNNSKIMKIENTYRNSQELINIAGSFIMKNKNQIRKNLKSNKHIQFPIEIIYYKNITTTFINLINDIYNKTKKPILVLGRNNNDINLIKNNKLKIQNNIIIYKENKKINIRYLTIHKSKGLEEENVIIINLINNKTGFPNKIKNEKIINYVTPNKEKFKYAEERRLMYVALTRTKNKVYLLTPTKKESIFIKELKRNCKKQIIIKKK